MTWCSSKAANSCNRVLASRRCSTKMPNLQRKLSGCAAMGHWDQELFGLISARVSMKVWQLEPPLPGRAQRRDEAMGDTLPVAPPASISSGAAPSHGRVPAPAPASAGTGGRGCGGAAAAPARRVEEGLFWLHFRSTILLFYWLL